MASKKTDPQPHTYTISVVGLSGVESIKGPVGVGKSCLCNRFVRPAEDDFYVEHPSFLSAADFNGPVINNDHFLYWGKVSRHSDDNTEYNLHIIEQTEFLDDTTFAALRAGRTDPYLKRCSQIKIQSAEKLMYICRDQLGLEDQFAMVSFPSGKVTIDGFICVVDVSKSQQRSLETQLEIVTKILLSLVKTKKPIVLATTKMDEGSEAIIQETHKILSRKEFKGMIPMIETSALYNINVEAPFMMLTSLLMDKSRISSRPKIPPYSEALRQYEDKQDAARRSFHTLLNSVVTDYRIQWPACERVLSTHHEHLVFVEMFGQRKARTLFNNRIAQLRQDFISKRKRELLSRIPGILDEYFPTLQAINNRNWESCLRVIAQRPEFSQRFVQPRNGKWSDDDRYLDAGDPRMPFDLMASHEVEEIFTQHLRALQAELRRQMYMQELEKLLLTHTNIIPGAPITEMEVILKGRDCYDKLSPLDRSEIYQKVQPELRDRAKKDFLELLYERMDIFHQYDDPDKSITQEDVEALMNKLRSEPKCRALSRYEEDRKVIMLNHLGFLQFPIKEQCPYRANCMELALQKALGAKQKRSHQSSQVQHWTPNPDERHINLLIIGADGLATDLVHEIRMHYEEDEYHFNDKDFSLDYRTIDGDVSLSHNSLKIPDFVAHGCILVYSTLDSLKFIYDTVEKTFLAPSDEKLQYQGLPVVLLQALDSSLTEKAYLYLQEEGRLLAQRLRCEFIEMPEVIDLEESVDFNQFSEVQIPRSMREIAIQLDNSDTVDSSSLYKAPFGDIRLLMCHMCADPYPLDLVLQPFLAMQSCHVVTNDRYHVIQFDTYIADVKRKVEVILASYHEAILLKDEYCHGYIMVYSTQRKASYSMVQSYIKKIPRIPSLVVAVTEQNLSDSELMYANKGRLLAEQYSSYFITTTDFHSQSPYTQLLKGAWDYHQQSIAIRDDSSLYNNSTLDSSAYGSYDNSPIDPYKYSTGSGGKKQWTEGRSAFYVGTGWIDNNDVYYKDRIHAPLADRIEIPDYEDPVDALSDSSEEYALVHDALPAGKIQRVHSTLKREFKPAFPHTDSESDMSSLERNTFTRSPILHRRGFNPRMGTGMLSPHGHRRALSPASHRDVSNVTERKSNSLPRTVVHSVNQLDTSWEDSESKTQTMKSDTPSEGSEKSADIKRNKSFKSLKLRKPELWGGDEDAGFLEKFKNSVTINSAEKQRRKSVKKKQREEEKVLREAKNSVRRKLKSRLKRQSYLSKSNGMVLQDYVQAEGQLIPKFVELCVRHIEAEGFFSEGIYRIPGNQSDVEVLKQMFAHNNSVSIPSLNIHINAVATALKKFFSDLAEPLIPIHLNEELSIACSIPENSSRLLALRGVIKKLPPANHEVLKYLATHLYKITKHSEVNNMNSVNISICWWPTLMRPDITTVSDFQRMGEAMQIVTKSLIDQHGFFFYNEHEV